MPSNNLRNNELEFTPTFGTLQVKELVNGEHLAGNHRIIWTGTDTSGRSVSSGVYFVKVEQGGKSYVRKMMLLK